MNRKFLLIMAVLIPTSVFAQQFLPVKGIVNARDLGGYTMLDGRIVQSGRLLRAAHLADATDEDIRNLERLPVTAVIDFRKEQEKVGKVDREVPGARYTSLPVDPSGNAMATATEEEKKKFSGQKKFDVRKVIVFAAFNKKAQAVAREMYPTLLFDPDCQQQLSRCRPLPLHPGERPYRHRIGPAAGCIGCRSGNHRGRFRRDQPGL